MKTINNKKFIKKEIFYQKIIYSNILNIKSYFRNKNYIFFIDEKNYLNFIIEKKNKTILKKKISYLKKNSKIENILDMNSLIKNYKKSISSNKKINNNIFQENEIINDFYELNKLIFIKMNNNNDLIFNIKNFKIITLIGLEVRKYEFKILKYFIVFKNNINNFLFYNIKSLKRINFGGSKNDYEVTNYKKIVNFLIIEIDKKYKLIYKDFPLIYMNIIIKKEEYIIKEYNCNNSILLLKLNDNNFYFYNWIEFTYSKHINRIIKDKNKSKYNIELFETFIKIIINNTKVYFISINNLREIIFKGLDESLKFKFKLFKNLIIFGSKNDYLIYDNVNFDNYVTLKNDEKITKIVKNVPNFNNIFYFEIFNEIQYKYIFYDYNTLERINFKLFINKNERIDFIREYKHLIHIYLEKMEENYEYKNIFICKKNFKIINSIKFLKEYDDFIDDNCIIENKNLISMEINWTHFYLYDSTNYNFLNKFFNYNNLFSIYNYEVFNNKIWIRNNNNNDFYNINDFKKINPFNKEFDNNFTNLKFYKNYFIIDYRYEGYCLFDINFNKVILKGNNKKIKSFKILGNFILFVMINKKSIIFDVIKSKIINFKYLNYIHKINNIVEYKHYFKIEIYDFNSDINYYFYYDKLIIKKLKKLNLNFKELKLSSYLN